MATTVEEELNSIGLGKYAEVFAANDVDLRALPHLDAADLQELGVLSRAPQDTYSTRSQPCAGPGRGKSRPGHRTGPRRRRSAARRERGRRDRRGKPRPQAAQRPILRHGRFHGPVGSIERGGDARPDQRVSERRRDRGTRFGGYVAEFLGDGVLVYFGWPMAYEDHAERAIRAGLAAIDAVAQLKTAAGEPLEARVGIATGRVVVGDLAGGGVLDRGQVAGYTPNLAARLQTIADPGQVVIADLTHRLAGQAFEFEALGTRELKGSQDSVAVFLVRCESKVESRFDAARGDALSRFVGRSSELGMLLERWELAKGGRGQAVL